MDIGNGYHLDFAPDGSSIGYDSAGEEIFSISSDGLLTLNNANNIDVVSFSIGNKTYEIDHSEYCIRTNNPLTGEYDEYFGHADGTYEHCFYNNNDLMTMYDDNGKWEKIFYDEYNREVRYEYWDKTYAIVNSDETTFYDEYNRITDCYFENGTRFKINYHEDGTWEKIWYDDENHEVKRENMHGEVYYVNEDKESIGVNVGDKKYYSRINHIEYDEENYQKLLYDLIGINSEYNSLVKEKCQAIDNVIDTFIDHYSSEIGNIDNSLSNNLKSVNLLKENINYSLLAYQTCDNELLNGANRLIEHLFDENESNLSKRFRNAIDQITNDEDEDGILTYIDNVNFKALANGVIPTKVCHDKKGNKLFFNSNNKLIGIKGENVSLVYGGKKFFLNVTDNGTFILHDSQNNPLDIFADYNIDTSQFGGDQRDLRNVELLLDSNVQRVLDRYYPTATDEERFNYLEHAASSGCGYMAMTNMTFKYFEGREEDFYQTFGYPMYDICLENGHLSVDYNYEPLAIDLFSYNNKKNKIISATYDARGIISREVDDLSNYLLTEYNVDFNSNTTGKPYILIGEKNYSLYTMDGKIKRVNGRGHGMIVVGYTDDGRPIVSSWGGKYYLERSTNQDDIDFSNKYNRIFYFGK